MPTHQLASVPERPEQLLPERVHVGGDGDGDLRCGTALLYCGWVVRSGGPGQQRGQQDQQPRQPAGQDMAAVRGHQQCWTVPRRIYTRAESGLDTNTMTGLSPSPTIERILLQAQLW